MSYLSLMIVDPSVAHPEIDSYNKIVTQSPVRCSYHLPAMMDGKSMKKELTRSCGIIIFGSAASVNDENEWQNPLREIIDNAITKDMPLLGICYGHQLLAHHFGGKVDYLWNKQQKKGIRSVHFKSNNLIKTDTTFDLIHAHQEGAINCPKDFNISAESKEVKIEGIMHKTKAIWGFQTHIEASWSFAKRQNISNVDYKKVDENGTRIIREFFNYL